MSVVASPSEETSAMGPCAGSLRCTEFVWRPEASWFCLLFSMTLSKFLHVSGAGPFLWVTGGMLA